MMAKYVATGSPIMYKFRNAIEGHISQLSLPKDEVKAEILVTY